VLHLGARVADGNAHTASPNIRTLFGMSLMVAIWPVGTATSDDGAVITSSRLHDLGLHLIELCMSQPISTITRLYLVVIRASAAPRRIDWRSRPVGLAITEQVPSVMVEAGSGPRESPDIVTSASRLRPQ
jgi:hypothetical protein